MHAVDQGQRSYWSGPPVGATNVKGTVCQWLFTCWPWDILRIDFLAPPPNDAKALTQVIVIDNLLVFALPCHWCPPLAFL